MKRKLVLLTAMMMAAICLFGCGKSSDGAKNSKKTYKVGIVQYVDDASLNQIQKAVQTELDTQGKKLNVKFDYKDYTFNGQADQSTLNQIMADLVADQVDIIVPIATPTAVVAQSATEDNQIPVVFSAVSDPVAAGLVKSMDKPGSNITGVSDALNTDAFMKMITTAKTVKKIGFLYDKISLAADALIAAKVNAVFTPTDNTVMLAELAIYEKFIKAKIPHYGGADSFALNGAFCGYGVNYEELGTQTGKMVVDILVNGKKPADMAVASLANGIATVNTETASAIGLDYSSFKDLCEQVKETKTAEEFDQ